MSFESLKGVTCRLGSLSEYMNEYKRATLTKNFLTSENTSSEYKFNFLHTFFFIRIA